MNSKIKNIIVAALGGIWIFGLLIWGIIARDGDISTSERRRLAQMPELSQESLSSGKFMTDFEKYSADQFPLRDDFRRIKSIAEFYIFAQKDSNKIFVQDGYASKLEYPLNEDSVELAGARFENVYNRYLNGKAANIYFSLIYDKNYYMPRSAGYPTLDYEKMQRELVEKMPYAEYIDISGTMELLDFYKTDTHWRQEKILDTARALAEGMGVSLEWQYEEKALDKPFYGVYHGQSALPLKADEIKYLWNDGFESVTVYNYEIEDYSPIYDLERADGLDPYEIFLSGPRSLMVLENPNASTDKELIIFRDSYGSSIAPLLIEGYKKITLVDIRYLASQLVGNFVDFEGKDVLFLYSTLVLNNATTLK